MKQTTLNLPGGANKGAYQAGAFYRMAQLGIRPDVVWGISVGAINALRICEFPIGKEMEAAEALRADWHSIETSDVLKNWFGWYLTGYFKGSLMNSNPLRKYLLKHSNVEAVKKSGRGMRVGAVSLKTMMMHYFDETFDDLIGAVLASSSFPVFMNPVKLDLGDEDKELFTDGGVRDTSPIGQAIQEGATEIYSIATGPDRYTGDGIDPGANLKDIIGACVNAMSQEISSNDLKMAEMVNEILQLREIIESYGLRRELENFKDRSHQNYAPIHRVVPLKTLTSDPLKFEPKEMARVWEQGYEDAKEQL